MHKNLKLVKKPVKIGVLFLFEPSKTPKYMILIVILFWLKINQFKLSVRFSPASGFKFNLVYIHEKFSNDSEVLSMIGFFINSRVDFD
jgi:hypothetical protein